MYAVGHLFHSRNVAFIIYIYIYTYIVFFLDGKMFICIHHFFSFAFLFFVSHHIFVLCDQNSDLAGNMSFHGKKIICNPALQESPCNDYLLGWSISLLGSTAGY